MKAFRFNPYKLLFSNLLVLALLITWAAIYNSINMIVVVIILIAVNVIEYFFMNSEKNIHYLNDTVKCRLKPSLMHGIGVFALRDIKKGEKLYVYGCQKDLHTTYVFSMDSLNKLTPNIHNLILERWGINLSNSMLRFKNPNCTIMARFLNHSNNANSDGYNAVCDIKEGDEITENYNNMLKGKTIPKEIKEYYNFLQ